MALHSAQHLGCWCYSFCSVWAEHGTHRGTRKYKNFIFSSLGKARKNCLNAPLRKPPPLHKLPRHAALPEYPECTPNVPRFGSIWCIIPKFHFVVCISCHFYFISPHALSKVLLSCLSFLEGRNYQGIGDHPSCEFATQQREQRNMMSKYFTY